MQPHQKNGQRHLPYPLSVFKEDIYLGIIAVFVLDESPVEKMAGTACFTGSGICVPPGSRSYRAGA